LGDESDWLPRGLNESLKLLGGTRHEAKEGKSCELVVLVGDGRIARAFRDVLAPKLVKIGIALKVDDPGNTHRFESHLRRGDYQAVYYGWQNDWPDYGNMLSRLRSRYADCAMNMRVPCNLKDDQLDGLITAAERIDPVERQARNAAWGKVAEWLAKERPYIPIMCPLDVRVISARVELPELPWSAANTIRFLKLKEE
jgi:ABC-type oligopeptide transport system substrate-binding subunit